MSDLDDLISRYDGFVFDQYGVLHDGQTPYPGAIAALQALHRTQKPVVLVTNSGRTAVENADRLTKIGFEPNLFQAIVTSGDLASARLATQKFTALFVISRGGVSAAYAALPRTTDPTLADFLLISGSEADTVSEATYRAQLGPMAARSVPALCSNPDLQMLTPTGLRPAAGQIARWYEEAGGQVVYSGKPWPQIYEDAVKRMDLHPDASICCVGDSLHHDILGGARAGLATALVRTGVHADLTLDELHKVSDELGIRPDHVLHKGLRG
ncbi:MAG: TIGR01459 family HAD-type hydrolase [Pseudomonadota bacterium]